MPTPRAALDAKALHRTERMVGRRAMVEIVELFLEHAPSELERLVEASASAECAVAARAAHSLRNSAFNVGALRLYDVAGRMERAALASDADVVRRERDELLDAFEAARAGLEDWRRARDAAGS